MKKIDRVLKQLSHLYEFNRRLKTYRMKNKGPAKKRLERDANDRRTSQS